MEEANRCELEIDLSKIDQNQRPSGSWLCCLPCYWLKRNSGFHKLSLTIVTLLVTVLLVASPVLFLISSIPGEKSKPCFQQEEECRGTESENICSTEECEKAGNRISTSMSWKANPCEDFYEFACGSWHQKPSFPDRIQTKFQQDHLNDFVTLQHQVDRNIEQLLTVAGRSDPFQKLGIFYNSCLQEGNKRSSLLPMISLLEELGGYVVPNEYPPGDLTDLVLNLLRLNGAPLFDIYLDADLDNSSESAPFIDLPYRGGLNLAFRQWWHRDRNYSNFPSFINKKYDLETFSRDENESKTENKAYEFIKASIEEKRLLVMEKIMGEFMPKNFSSDVRVSETRVTLHFANVVTKVYPREKEILKNYQRGSNAKMAVDELERKFPFIRWQYLLEKFLKFKMTSRDHVFILTPDYLETLQRVLHRFTFRVVHNGVLLMFATDTLYDLVNGSSSRDQAIFCNRLTVKAFAEAVSILYVRQYEQQYIQQLRSRVTHVFDTLKKSFEMRVESLSWLDDQTKKGIFGKLANLRIEFLSWPNYWNATYAKAIMENVQVDQEDFFGNVIRRYRQLRNFSVDFKRDQSEEKRWAYPFVVNAFYVLTLNTIIIPLALLTQPYFREDVPTYIPYSTIGLIIAHEIFHAFDLKGIGYDHKGGIGVIMTPGSRVKFEARIDCFVKQFSSSLWKKVHFLGRNIDIQFDWNMTKNENMADISGLQLALRAWKTSTESVKEAKLPGVLRLNSQQLFFLNAAQTYCTMLSPADYIFLVEIDFHTPQPERVNGIMMNSREFAEAYKCPVGSPMNPRKKCSTW